MKKKQHDVILITWNAGWGEDPPLTTIVEASRKIKNSKIWHYITNDVEENIAIATSKEKVENYLIDKRFKSWLNIWTNPEERTKEEFLSFYDIQLWDDKHRGY